jgi:hypothetical protein
MPDASPASDTRPPVLNVVHQSDGDAIAPSLLTTLDSSSAIDHQQQQQQVAVSVHQIRYELSENGIHISVPVANEYRLPKNNNNGTYNDGYDSDGELRLSDEEDKDEETGQPAQPAPVNNESMPVISEAVPVKDLPPPLPTEPPVMAMTANQLKDELAKRKLSKNGVKAALQQRLLTVMTNLPNTSESNHIMSNH